MPPEKWKFDEWGDQYKARKEDARLHAEIDEWEGQEKHKTIERRQYIKETEHFLNWIGEMLSRHPVGKEPGRRNPSHPLWIMIEKLSQNNGKIRIWPQDACLKKKSENA